MRREFSRLGQNCLDRKTPGSVQLHYAVDTKKPRGVPLISIPKVVGLMSCGFLLCLGLSHAAQADDASSAKDDMKAGQSDRTGGQAGVKGHQDKLKRDDIKARRSHMERRSDWSKTEGRSDGGPLRNRQDDRGQLD